MGFGIVVGAATLAAAAVVLPASSSAVAAETPEAVWNRHLDRVAQGFPIQEACRPQRFLHAGGGPAKGMLVVYHGYTACPNQFLDLGREMAAQGYDVYVPLMWGQGAQAGWDRDASAFLPDHLNFMNMEQDAQLGIELAKAYPATTAKTIAGLSGGGTVAWSALLHEPELFDRALLLAPYLQGWLKTVRILSGGTGVTTRLRLIGESPTDWGADCFDANRRGRGGYCLFKKKNVAALQRYSNWVRERTEQRLREKGGKFRFRTVVQLIGARTDRSVHNGTAANLILRASRIPAGQEPKARICVIDGAPHPFPGVYDNLDRVMFWRESYLDGARAFLTEGTLFPRQNGGRRPLGLGYSKCELYKPSKRLTGLQAIQAGE